MRAASVAASFLLLLALAGTASGQIPAGAPVRDGVPTLAPILERTTPAVVNIAVLQRSPEDDNPLLRDPFFRRFFGLPGESQPQVSAGSGVIVDAKNGYVITNAHVIKEAQAVAVTLKDGRRLPASLVGADPPTDIALVKIDPKGLAQVPWGDSDALQVGDFVIAIGNPFGVGQTATSGIVSALGRTGINAEGYEHFIQTDASINPGNSGGALVNLKGELIGINTAIYTPAGGNVGIGFAVPSFIARAVVEQLIRFGEVRRGRLGIAMQNVSGAEGAAITEVVPGSPAARAGLQKGDRVLAVNGRPVLGSAERRARLSVVPVGEQVELRVQRGGEARTVRATIGAVDPQERRVSAGQAVGALAGAELADAESRSAQGRDRAVLVSAVEAGSPAYRLGLRAGDLIVAVNRRRVNSVQELARALNGRGRAALTILRGDAMVSIPVR